jgi:DNA-directed RNA polymerase specialized sigma24 family protein
MQKLERPTTGHSWTGVLQLSGGVMPENGERDLPATGDPVAPGADAVDAMAEIFEPHLAHLFDYCQSLLGRADRAAGTARSVVTSADALLHDPDRLRAWLFGLARRHALAVSVTDGAGPRYAPQAVIGADHRDLSTADRTVTAFGALTDGDREVLDLVYRHGIRPADLEAVLGIAAAEAFTRLAAAEQQFMRIAAQAPAGEVAAAAQAGLTDIGSLPLAATPASVARHSRQPDLDPRAFRHRWRAPELRVAGVRTFNRRRVRLTAAALIPAAVIPIAVVFVTQAGHGGIARDAPPLRSSRPSPSAQLASTPRPAPSRGAGVQPIYQLVPVASRAPVASARPTVNPAGTPQPAPSPG